MFIIIDQVAKHNHTSITPRTYQVQNSETINNIDESTVSFIYVIFKIINIENIIYL